LSGDGGKAAIGASTYVARCAFADISPINPAQGRHRYADNCARDRSAIGEANNNRNAMIDELAVAAAMVITTVRMHGVGLAILSKLLRLESRDERRLNIHPLSPSGIGFTLLIVIGLFFLHGLEIWAYAALFLVLGAIPDLYTAVYFSTITYGTIGYDDDPIAGRWSLVSAIEGINGVLLLGWSTAFFVTVVARLGRS